MKIRALALAVMAAALCSSATAQDAPAALPADLIDPADMAWEQLPGPQDLSRYYPERGKERRQSGRAVVHCLIGPDRRPTDCVLIGETPDGHGFGEATLRIASKFQAKPTTKSGRPTVGRRALVKMTWTIV